MSEASTADLSKVTEKSEACDYAATGFHQRHDVAASALVAAARAFLDAGYILEMITCQDLRGEDLGMRLAYTFNRWDRVDRHLVLVTIPAELEVAVDHEFEGAPSLSALAGGANWMEREVYDMYGVRFTDHPDLDRILLPEDANFFPLRKDFGRPEDAEVSDGE
jgi:NADH-quinone oxidoreductase subunit C